MHRRQHEWPRFALALALASTACSDPAQPGANSSAKRLEVRWQAPTPLLVGNWLRNPGFEAGTADWGLLGRKEPDGIEIAAEPVHSGGAAAYLLALWERGSVERPWSFAAASQEISPPRFPDLVAGWYRVERWEDAPELEVLQLQVLIAAFGDPRTRDLVAAHDPEAEPPPARLDNLQLRYQLAGSARGAQEGGNVKRIVIGEGPPQLQTWVRFELPLKADFARVWGTLPQAYDRLRIMFGVRWDDKPKGAALRADVYYDDLFFGFEDLPSRGADPPQH